MKKFLTFVLLLTVLCAISSCVLAGENEGNTSAAESETTLAPETTAPVTDAESAEDQASGEESTTESTLPEESTTEPDSAVTDPFPENKMDLLHMDLTPYITLGSYKNVAVSAKEIGYIITLHQSMLSNETCYTKVTTGDRTVAEGDVINVNYKGFLDGVAFQGGEASDQTITVFEDGTYISGFALGFLGAKPGESSSFRVTFPENYGEQSLAGKEVTFEFTVNYIYAFSELTDVLASELSNGAYPTAEAYEAYQRNLLIQPELWLSIVDDATIHAYPEEQVLYYYGQTREYYTYYAQYYGMTYETFLSYIGMTDEDVYASARLCVEEDLVYYAILQTENITLTDADMERLEHYIQRYKEEYGYTDEQIEANLGAIKDNMLYDKVQELLIEWADVRWE